jgi:hypothetical protein
VPARRASSSGCSRAPPSRLVITQILAIFFVPSGTGDNSPAIHCWEPRVKRTRSAAGTAEDGSITDARPSLRDWADLVTPFPAINCWAIFRRPYGTEKRPHPAMRRRNDLGNDKPSRAGLLPAASSRLWPDGFAQPITELDRLFGTAPSGATVRQKIAATSGKSLTRRLTLCTVCAFFERR